MEEEGRINLKQKKVSFRKNGEQEEGGESVTRRTQKNGFKNIKKNFFFNFSGLIICITILLLLSPFLFYKNFEFFPFGSSSSAFSFCSFSLASSPPSPFVSASPSFSSSSSSSSAFSSASSTNNSTNSFSSSPLSASSVHSRECIWGDMFTYLSNVLYGYILPTNANKSSSSSSSSSSSANAGKLNNKVENSINAFISKIKIYIDSLPAWVPLWAIEMPIDTYPYMNKKNKNDDKNNHKSHVSSMYALRPSIAEIDEDATTVLPILERLSDRTFFRIFKIVLDAECPFWAVQRMCSNPSGCSVCQCDESQIPTAYKMKPIEEFVDRKHLASFHRWSEQDKKPDNFWMKADELKMNSLLSDLNDERKVKATYVDLKLNRPSYTSYKGGKVWHQMYQENKKMGCEENDEEKMMMLKNDDDEKLKECEEVNNFKKIVSGMQLNIDILSAEYHFFKKHDTHDNDNINSGNDDYVVQKKNNQFDENNKYKDGHWEYSMDYFRRRVAPYPDRIENLYFTFSVLLKTVCHLAPILQECSCETGDDMGDLTTRADLFQFLNQTFTSCQPKYIDQPLFYRKTTEVLSTFSTISRILDCVECEKCKLHGKLKMTALQLALRASSYDHRIASLERNEVTALINALAYFADSIRIIKVFQRRLFWLRVKFFGGIFLLIACFIYLLKIRSSKRIKVSETKKEE